MTTPLIITRDINGYPTTGSETGHPSSDTAQYFTMTANTIKTVVVPNSGDTRRMLAVFTYGIDTGNPVVWVQPTATPTLALPTGTVAATTAAMNPRAVEVSIGQTLQILTDQAGVRVSIVYYRLTTGG